MERDKRMSLIRRWIKTAGIERISIQDIPGKNLRAEVLKG